MKAEREMKEILKTHVQKCKSCGVLGFCQIVLVGIFRMKRFDTVFKRNHKCNGYMVGWAVPKRQGWLIIIDLPHTSVCLQNCAEKKI